MADLGIGFTTSIPTASKRMNELVSMMRMFTRDYPEFNRLIQGEESSDRMIAWAILDALDDYNSTPPFLAPAGLTNFPSLSLLKEGTIIRLLESVGLLQTRNHLQFVDGGITVGHSDKTPMIMQWLQYYRASYEDKKNRIKSSINVEQAMGGTGTFSEYLTVNGLYFVL